MLPDRRTPFSRRDFLKVTALSVASLGLSACGGLFKAPATLTPEPPPTPTREDLARQLSEKYGLEIQTLDTNVENYGLPFSAEELIQKIKSREVGLSFYGLGARTEELTQFYQFQKDDLLHPGEKENLIIMASNTYSAQEDMPGWVLGLLNTDKIMVATAVDEVVNGRLHRKFLGIRQGLLSTIALPSCDYTLGCREEETLGFIEKELGLITYYTLDEKGLTSTSP